MLAKQCGVVLAKEWKFESKKKFERERESCELCKEKILKLSLQNGLTATTAAAAEGASSFFETKKIASRTKISHQKILLH